MNNLNLQLHLKKILLKKRNHLEQIRIKVTPKFL